MNINYYLFHYFFYYLLLIFSYFLIFYLSFIFLRNFLFVILNPFDINYFSTYPLALNFSKFFIISNTLIHNKEKKVFIFYLFSRNFLIHLS